MSVRALSTTVEAAGVAGSKVVVVDVIDSDSVAFYGHHDLQTLPMGDRSVLSLSPLNERSVLIGGKPPAWKCRTRLRARRSCVECLRPNTERGANYRK